jgi:hypothetical protein
MLTKEIFSHPITFPKYTFDIMSGYSRVAKRAVSDVWKKDNSNNNKVSEMTRFKKAQIKNVLKRNVSQKEERVSFKALTLWDSPETQNTVRKGRFLITTTVPNEKKEPKKVGIARKGRFLVTQYVLLSKQEKKKPITTRKGRFLVTTTY